MVDQSFQVEIVEYVQKTIMTSDSPIMNSSKFFIKLVFAQTL